MPQQEGRDRWQAEVGNPAHDAQNREILSADQALRSIVAGNPATRAPLLEALAQDQDEAVRQVVVSNPNTPWKSLEALAWEFPGEFLSNPSGPLQLLAHPEHVSTDVTFWSVLLRVSPIPLCGGAGSAASRS